VGKQTSALSSWILEKIKIEEKEYTLNNINKALKK
jgi:hypothetical protein